MASIGKLMKQAAKMQRHRNEQLLERTRDAAGGVSSEARELEPPARVGAKLLHLNLPRWVGADSTENAISDEEDRMPNAARWWRTTKCIGRKKERKTQRALQRL